MNHSILKTRYAQFNSILMQSCLGFLTVTTYPWFLFWEKFIPRADRERFWRQQAVWIIKTTFAVAGVKIKVLSPNKIHRRPAIYASNHPTSFDGFVLLTILKENAVLFTAPLAQFPFPLNLWIKKMGGIDVRRDVFDDERYPTANTKEQAIEKAIQTLKQGNSLVIFPEGHIELAHVLHYFHTGPARISLESHVPIVPVAQKNSDHVFADSNLVYPGELLVEFCDEINPTIVESIEIHPTQEQVRQVQRKIEQAIVQKLPIRFLPQYYYLDAKDIGVFVDIDRTIYDGFSQKDFVKFLFKEGKLNTEEAFKIFGWLMMEKSNMLNHHELMERSLSILHGWSVKDLHREIENFFNSTLLEKIHYGIFPLIVDHQKKGHKVVFVTEVIHPLADKFKNFFNITATLDTHLNVKHNHYTGATRCLCYQDEKAEMIKRFSQHSNLDLKESFAYADSHSDIPFLKIVKFPTAVNPDRELLNFAIKNEIPIIKHPK